MKKNRTASKEFPHWYVALQVAILQQLPRPGVIDQDTALGWCDNQGPLKKVLAEALLLKSIRETYKVTVDYSKTLSVMIELGNYDWFNDDITEKHFLLQGEGQHEVELELVHLNRDTTTKEALEYIRSLDLEPAKIEHQLALGAAKPELQKQFPIVAFGSMVGFSSGRRCSSLDFLGGHRKLLLLWVDGDDHWRAHCRFLAVRKEA